MKRMECAHRSSVLRETFHRRDPPFPLLRLQSGWIIRSLFGLPAEGLGGLFFLLRRMLVRRPGAAGIIGFLALEHAISDG